MDSDFSSPSMDREADDTRFALAAMAARRARRNRPRRLVAFSVVIMLGAGAAAMWGSLQRTSAAGQLQDARTELAAVEQLVPQYQQAASRGSENPFVRVPDLVTRIENLARRSGLDNPLPSAPTRDTPRGSLIETSVTINNIRNRTLEPVIDWITQVTDQIPGVEIERLEIRPDTQGWTVNVTFLKPYRPQSERTP
ncbi:MAG: hypothetical protein ACF8R7_08970 [Phycisphaerales bacterium JB039]